jgi:anti-sigma B factor antagonist
MALQLQRRTRDHGASNDAIVVHFTGGKVSLDEEALYDIRDQLLALANEPTNSDLLLDFGNVRYLTSTTLGTLVSLHKKLRARGRLLTISNLTPQVYEVFAVTRLDQLFDLRLAEPCGSNAFT